MIKLLNNIDTSIILIAILLFGFWYFSDYNIQLGMSIFFFLILVIDIFKWHYLTKKSRIELIEIFYGKEINSITSLIFGKISIILSVLLSIFLFIDFDFQILFIFFINVNLAIRTNTPILQWEIIVENNILYFQNAKSINIPEIIFFEKQTNGSIYFETKNRKRVVDFSFEVADDLSEYLFSKTQ